MVNMMLKDGHGDVDNVNDYLRLLDEIAFQNHFILHPCGLPKVMLIIEGDGYNDDDDDNDCHGDYVNAYDGIFQKFNLC